jgi:hypothetical protein
MLWRNIESTRAASSPSLPPNEKHVPTIRQIRRHLRRWNPVKPNKTVAVCAGAAEFSTTFLHGLLLDLSIMAPLHGPGAGENQEHRRESN